MRTHKAAGPYPENAGEATSAAPASAANGERILLLECRLEQLRAALDEARAEADKVRVKLAEAAAREADHARRHGLIQQELADARADIASLHERLDRSQALRAELEGHLFEAGARGDAAELIRLRREVLAQRQRAIINERTCTRLRTRVDELLLSRETLLTRVAEWQRLVQKEGPAAADLAEFMAELRGDILHLEHRNAAGERQEAALRERLIRAGLDPDAPHAADVPAATFGVTEELPLLDLPEPTDADAYDGAESADASLHVATHESDGVDLFESAASTAAEPTEAPDLFEDATSSAEEEDGSASDRLEAGDPEVAEERGPAEPAESAHTAEAEDASSEREARGAVAPAGGLTDPSARVRRDWVRDATASPEPEREKPTAAAAAVFPPVEGLRAADPSTRAAAYERLTRMLDGDPARLAEHLRPGLADPHPRVRRRAVLAAATAQRLPLRPLLEPLQGDPDPHVRRVVREVLRHARPAEPRAEGEDEVVVASTQARPGTRS